MTGLQAARNELRANPHQWEAFTTEGPCVVLAPPGSGKTKLLTARLAEDLLARIQPPRGAACITLTNSAAGELARRLEDLGVRTRSTLFVGTVHSFALSRIISPYAPLVGLSSVAQARMATVYEKNVAFRNAVQTTYEPGEDTRYLRPTLDRARHMLLPKAQWKIFGAKMMELADSYEANLRRVGLIDFDDVVAIAVGLVENHEFVRRALSARYPFLYVDEYQDLAPGLDRIVRALCFGPGSRCSLFAVGDPDQAIYGWTGTRPELLADLAALPEVRAVRLSINFRCGQQIIEHSRRVLDGEREMGGVSAGGTVTAVHCATGFAEQCDEAVRLIQAAESAGSPLEQIAVLCQANDDCVSVALHLRTAGIPTVVRSDDYRQTPATLLVEALAAWATFDPGTSGYRLHELLERWRSLHGRQGSRVDEVALATLLRSYRGGGGLAAEFVRDLIAVGLGRALAASARGEDAIEIGRMLAACESGALQSLAVQDLGRFARPAGRVAVTTMSSSKGLEFDTVILLKLEEGIIPFFNSLDKPNELAEERRKFYVSITRARRSVFLLYSGWYRNQYGRTWRNGPSRFLREIGAIS
jgi:DNA helicase II / ATP-dependent DNA helicase PcrA